MATRRIILPLLLLLQTFYGWKNFYKARFLPYDDNYNILIDGFLVALLAFFLLAGIWVLKRPLIKDNRAPIIIWAIVGSPLSFVVAFLFYHNIFGTSLSG